MQTLVLFAALFLSLSGHAQYVEHQYSQGGEICELPFEVYVTLKKGLVDKDIELAEFIAGEAFTVKKASAPQETFNRYGGCVGESEFAPGGCYFTEVEAGSRDALVTVRNETNGLEKEIAISWLSTVSQVRVSAAFLTLDFCRIF